MCQAKATTNEKLRVAGCSISITSFQKVLGAKHSMTALLEYLNVQWLLY